VAGEIDDAVRRAGQGDVFAVQMLLSFCRRVTDACRGAQLMEDSARLWVTSHAFCDPARARLTMPDASRKIADRGLGDVPQEYRDREEEEQKSIAPREVDPPADEAPPSQD
jgi:hypothetical protein